MKDFDYKITSELNKNPDNPLIQIADFLLDKVETLEKELKSLQKDYERVDEQLYFAKELIENIRSQASQKGRIGTHQVESMVENSYLEF